MTFEAIFKTQTFPETTTPNSVTLWVPPDSHVCLIRLRRQAMKVHYLYTFLNITTEPERTSKTMFGSSK